MRRIYLAITIDDACLVYIQFVLCPFVHAQEEVNHGILVLGELQHILLYGTYVTIFQLQ